MLHNRRLIMDIHIREGMRTALVTQQQRVALTIVTRIIRLLSYTHQAPVRVLTMSGRDTLADNGTTGILTQMNHLRTRIRLLVVVRHRHTVEFRRRVISRQNTGRVFPRNSRTCLYLCPGKFTVRTFAVTTFRNKVINTAFTFGITRIPVLHGAVLHLRTFVHHNLHDSGMQLVLIAHRSRTTFQIGNIRIIIRHNQRPLKLTCITRIDTEIRG